MELRLSEELPNGNASAMLLADPVLVSEFVVSCAPAFILGRRRSISGSCRRLSAGSSKTATTSSFGANFDFAVGSAGFSFCQTAHAETGG
jgi:hypothetical protein